MPGELPPKITLPGGKQTDTSRLKTDTSRLKTGGTTPAAPQPPPPVTAQPPPGQPLENPTGATTLLTDPMTLRDTNTGRLRRVQADTQKPASAASVTPGMEMGKDKKGSTETVRLKVLREQKKEAGIGPAGTQTARLRPPAMTTAETTTPETAPAGEPVKVGGDASKTIRLEVPTGLTQPTAVPRPSEAQPPSKKPSTSTSKIPKTGAPRIPTGEVGQTAQATVKLDAPSASDTFKQPAPSAAAAGTAGQTVKLSPEDAGAARKTLKLKTPARPGKEGVATGAAPVAASLPAATALGAAARPDMLGLAASVVTVLAAAAMTVLLVMQVVAYVL